MLRIISKFLAYIILSVVVVGSCVLFYRNADFTVKQCDIVGCKYGNYLNEKKKMHEFAGRNLLFIREKDVCSAFASNVWINSVKVYKKVPNKLVVQVVEKVPVVIWRNKSEIKLLDCNNNAIEHKNLQDFAHLPIFSGKIEEFRKIWLVLEKYPAILERLLYIESVGDRRYNMCIAPNIIIKLPEKNIEKALKAIYSCDYGNIRKDISIIDCRVDDKIIVRRK